MCPHTFKKSKSLTKSYGTKQYHKSSYTIHERPPNEKHGEHTTTKKNASQFKITCVFK
jgi:hypothetical protein